MTFKHVTFSNNNLHLHALNLKLMIEVLKENNVNQIFVFKDPEDCIL